MGIYGLPTADEERLANAGKEAGDMIQAFVDPSKSKSKLQEMQEAAMALWNIQELFRNSDPRAIAFWVLHGAQLDIGKDYFPLVAPPGTPSQPSA